MDKILNVKYSLDRNEEYQIKTIIYEKMNIKYVCKEAYSHKALGHIQRIFYNFKLLSSLKMNIVDSKLEGNKIEFPFIEGINFAQVLLEDIKNKNKTSLEKNLLNYKELLFNEELIPFNTSTEFVDLFGVHGNIKAESHVISNIDLNFENVILNQNQFHIIDYEWVYEFPIPLEYVMYRAVTQFFVRYNSQIIDFISLQDVFAILEISTDMLNTFNKMEKNFIKKVANGWVKQRTSYSKKIISKYDLLDKYFEDSQKELNQIQLFWTDKEEFLESKSNFFAVKENAEIEYDLSDKFVSKIRIDPGENIFVKGVLKVTLSNKFDKFNLLKYLTRTSGLYIVKQTDTEVEFITLSIDSQFIFSGFESNKLCAINVEISIINNIDQIKNEIVNLLNLFISRSTLNENIIQQNKQQLDIVNEINIKNIKEIANLREINSNYFNEIEEIKKANVDYQKKLENAVKQNQKFVQEIEILKQTNSSLKIALEEILLSKRWKILSVFSKSKLNR